MPHERVTWLYEHYHYKAQTAKMAVYCVTLSVCCLCVCYLPFACGLWFVVCGLRFVVCGLRFVVCNLWFMCRVVIVVVVVVVVLVLVLDLRLAVCVFFGFWFVIASIIASVIAVCYLRFLVCCLLISIVMVFVCGSVYTQHVRCTARPLHSTPFAARHPVTRVGRFVTTVLTSTRRNYRKYNTIGRTFSNTEGWVGGC
jgi:hypothetical protein